MITWLSYFGFQLLISALPQEGLSLQAAFEKAKSVQASTLNADLEAEIAKKLKSEAYSEVLPKLSVYSNHDWQDEVQGSTTQNRSGSAYQHTAALKAEQSILSSDGRALAISSAKRYEAQLEAERLGAQIELFRNVSSSFYRLILLEKSLANFENQEKLLKDRVGLLRDRSRIGQSKTTDLVSARSESARINAQRIETQIQLERERRAFRALIGAETLPPLKDELKSEALQLPPEAEIKASPKLQASEEAIQIAEAEKRTTLAGFLPDVSVTGQYYLDRAGALSESKWDVGLMAEWEFFSGGRDYSRRQASVLRHRQAMNRYTQLLRDARETYLAEREIFELRLESLKALESSLELARQNYESQQREFRSGLVSNLDVLQSLDALLDARQNRDEASIDVKLSWLELHLLVGRIP